jgi:hypothetical protein
MSEINFKTSQARRHYRDRIDVVKFGNNLQILNAKLGTWGLFRENNYLYRQNYVSLGEDVQSMAKQQIESKNSESIVDLLFFIQKDVSPKVETMSNSL